jgi:hypothetical protein
MTLVELYERVTAFYAFERERQEEEYRRVAWQTAHLLNIAGKSLKRSITVDDLIGKNNKKQPQKLTAVEQKEKLDEVKEKFKQ